MGDLVVMTRSSVPSRETAHLGGSADILFFTGVRYYRITDDDLAETSELKRRRSEKAKRASQARRLKRRG